MTSNLLIFYAALALTNLIAFILVGVDKKRSVENSQRIREVYLFFIAIFFASLGVFLGMLFFRNKTRKIYFLLGMVLLMAEQGLLLALLTRYL